MIRREKNKALKVVAIGLAVMVTFAGCGKRSSRDTAPSINLEQYSKVTYNTVLVQQGDINSKVTLTLKPDEYEQKKYSINQSDYEVDEVKVKVGDKVKKDDVMITFKAEEIEEAIEEYEDEIAENQMLIDHYSKLMKIDSSEDYTSDIQDLRDDITLANTGIQEQKERLREYQVIAEKDGTVSYVNEYLEYGYATAGDNLVTVVSGSTDYTATTNDNFEFKVGDVYEAELDIAGYDMKVAKVDKSEDKATGEMTQVIIFEPVNEMKGVTESDTLVMIIDKPTISNVVYVDKNTIFKGNDEKDYVYVVNEDGYREAREVTVGETIDDVTIITEGLKAGEQVSTK